MILLSTVEDVFEIEGRGCVVVPGVSHNASVRESAAIELHLPDGSVVSTRIHALEFLDGPGRRTFCVPIILPPEFTKQDIPIGTKIWLL